MHLKLTAIAVGTVFHHKLGFNDQRFAVTSEGVATRRGLGCFKIVSNPREASVCDIKVIPFPIYIYIAGWVEVQLVF